MDAFVQSKGFRILLVLLLVALVGLAISIQLEPWHGLGGMVQPQAQTGASPHEGPSPSRFSLPPSSLPAEIQDQPSLLIPH